MSAFVSVYLIILLVDLGQWLHLASHRASVWPPCGLYLGAVHNEFCIACIEVYVLTAAFCIACIEVYVLTAAFCIACIEVYVLTAAFCIACIDVYVLTAAFCIACIEVYVLTAAFCIACIEVYVLTAAFCIACIEVYVLTAAFLIQDTVLLLNGIEAGAVSCLTVGSYARYGYEVLIRVNPCSKLSTMPCHTGE